MTIASYIADSEGKIKDLKHTYKSAGAHSIQMSNNAISLKYVSEAAANKIDIQSFNMGSNVLSVLDESFDGCTNLAVLGCSSFLKHIGDKSFRNNTSLNQVIFPSTLVHIGKQAFYGCTSLNSISFTSTKVHVGEQAFENCKLDKVDIHLANGSGSSIFKGNISLSEVTVDGQLTQQMFYGDSKLKKITLKSTTAVPAQCFYGNSSLESIALPAATNSLGEQCFYGCTKLSSLDLSKTKVTYLPSKFISGTAVKSLEIPASITSLSQVNSQCLAETSVSSMTLKGFTDEYMEAHLKEFTSFGSSSSIVFYSASGKKYYLDNSGEGIRNNSVCVISIGVEKTVVDRPLPQMYNDITRFCNMVKSVYGNNNTNVRYITCGDGGENGKQWDHMNPTRSDILAVFNELENESVKPDMLIFHYSDHGNYGNAGKSGHISLYNKTSIKYQELFEHFQKFNKVFAVFCCCYPWYGVNDKTLKTDSRILVWAAGKKAQKTKMDGGLGHFFMTALTESFSNEYSYNQEWTAAEKMGKFSYNTDDGRVRPQRYSYNDYNQDARIFT